MNEKEISEEEYYANLFDRSSVLLTDNDRHNLRQGKIGVAGLGGVGCICAEMLVRLGVGTIGVADPEDFEPSNLNRQIFSNYSSAYLSSAPHCRNKAEIAGDRIREINPFCNVIIFSEGITVFNVRDFIRQYSVVVNQVDRESIKCLIHRIAKEERIPMVSASRVAGDGHRWSVRSKVWNYRDEPTLASFEETNHPSLASIKTELLTEEILKEYDAKVHARMQERWATVITGKDFKQYGINDAKNAQLAMRRSPDMFHKQTVLAPIANIAGAMASIDVFKLLTGHDTKTLAFNLWDGVCVDA